MIAPDPARHERYLDTAALRTDVGGRAVRAASVTVGAQATLFVMSVAASIILARLLTPNDYGLFALVWTLVAFVEIFKDFGLPLATVQKSELSHEQVSTLFWMNVALGVAVALSTLLLAPAMGALYREPRLLALCSLMAGVFVVEALGAQHEALLKRQMEFAALRVIEVGAAAVGVFVAVGLALGGAGYWALAIQYIAAKVTKTISLWTTCRWRPDAPRRGAQVRSMIFYGGDVTGFRIMTHAGKHLDRVLLGYFHGATVVGLYTAAERWAMLTIEQVQTSLLPIAVSGFSHSRHDIGRYRDYYRKALLPLFGVILPTLTFMFVEAHNVVALLLGSQWLEAVPLFRALLFSALAASISQTTKWVYLAEGRTRRQLRWGLLSASIMMISVVVGVRWGALGVAVAYSAATCALALPGVAYCLKASPLHLRDFLGVVWRPALSSVGTAAVLLAVKPHLPLAGTGAEIASSLIIFGLTYPLLWASTPSGRQSLCEMLQLAKKAVPRGRAAVR
ncbi:MAG: lipopolysaccharide biosynthesis protein [Pyrinomonadaceae bacterium]